MQKLFAVFSLLSALLFSQIPELVQQYRQRLGGAVDELGAFVRNFDEDSRRSGYDRVGALAVMMGNPEKLVREQAQRMKEYVQRLDRLSQQQSALASGLTLAGFVSVLSNYDQPIMAEAWNAFAPAFPMTMWGAVFAIIGWSLCYGLLLFIGYLAGSRLRVPA
jgi:hypothetical protein